MNSAGFSLSELLGLITAFFLTLSILSYLFGDNIIFRTAVSIFVGVSAGLVVTSIIDGILIPKLLIPLAAGSKSANLLILIPLVLGIFLLAKAYPKLSEFGSPVMAFLVGIGAATIIGGAVLGTLMPLVSASLQTIGQPIFIGSNQIGEMPLFDSLLILMGLITALYSFQFTNLWHTRPADHPIWKAVFQSGRFFLAIALGVIFVGVLMASLAAIVDRANFLIDFFQYFLSPGI